MKQDMILTCESGREFRKEITDSRETLTDTSYELKQTVKFEMEMFPEIPERVISVEIRDEESDLIAFRSMKHCPLAVCTSREINVNWDFSVDGGKRHNE